MIPDPVPTRTRRRNAWQGLSPRSHPARSPQQGRSGPFHPLVRGIQGKLIILVRPRSFEEDDCERRDRDVQRIGPPVDRDGRRSNAAQVAGAASPVRFRVAVMNLPPDSLERDADAVVLAADGREVAGDEDRLGGVLTLSQIGKDAVRAIVGIDPFEAVRAAIQLMEGWLVYCRGGSSPVRGGECDHGNHCRGRPSPGWTRDSIRSTDRTHSP